MRNQIGNDRRLFLITDENNRHKGDIDGLINERKKIRG